MPYYKLKGLPGLDGETDGGAAAASQQAFGNTPSSGPGETSDQSSAYSAGAIAVAPAAGAGPVLVSNPAILGPSTPTNIESTNWSGGVITAGSGESFSTVSAQWVVPTIAQVPGVATSDVAEWVGIDGYQSSDVCQAGVYQEAQTSNGQTTLSCQAWVEWYPADAEFIPLSSFDVNPGNTIKVTVETSGAGATTATFILDNETTGQTYDTSLTAPNGTSLQGNSAEAIVETPELISGNGEQSQPPLADFLNSPVAFDNVSATYSNGSVASLSSAQSIGMWTDNNDPPGVNGSVQEAYGTIQPSSDSVTVTENDYWGGPATPPTTAEMITNDSSGNYTIYDLGNNAVLGSASLGNLGTGWTLAGIGNFGGDGGDLLMVNTSGGVSTYEVFDVSNNQNTGSSVIAATGANWVVAGIGDFSGVAGETDLMTRNTTSGNLAIYDISNNQVTSTTVLTGFGPNTTVAGFGDFSGVAGETDMMAETNNGNGTVTLSIYDMAHNSITSGPDVVAVVGQNWTVVGFGDFSGNPNETDMITRSTSGTFELYDITDNRTVSAQSLGTAGTEWSVVGFGNFSSNPGEIDMMTRDTNNGDIAIYDIADSGVTNAQVIDTIPLSQTVDGAGPDVPNTDTALSGSLIASSAPLATSADLGSGASFDASAGSGLSYAGAGDPQSFSIGGLLSASPSLDSFLDTAAGGAAASPQAWLGGVDASNSSGWLSQFGETSGASELVPPMSAFSAPAPVVDLSPALSEFGSGTPVMAANPLQHST
jgi:hypothetical protein